MEVCVTKTSWRQDRTERFRILHRDNFTCRYCGARPGSELLEVDHLVPVARGGSDEDTNKVSACRTCNRRKSDTIFFPHDLIERQDDEDGWFVHKTYGEWSIVFCDDRIGVEKKGYGFIEGHRMYEFDLIRHMHKKTWGAQVFRDMHTAFEHLRKLIQDPI